LDELWDGFVEALRLIVTLDPEVRQITLRSLSISATATALASLICIPLGGLISFRSFRGKRLLVNITQTLYSLPTVVVGLFVFLMLSRAGPLGGLRFLFTPTAIVIGEMILITPILLGMTFSALSSVDKSIKDTSLALGASERQAIWTIIKEAKFAIGAAIIMGFGRAISELGVAMMVGGNIRGYTRTLTTAMSLLTQRGEIEIAIALGIILLILALFISAIVNIALQRYS
jgi:tungstate transport system permease protein